MGKSSRLCIVLLTAAGLVLSILSGTSLCSFGGCTEAHLYRLFGLSFPAVGIAFFILAGLLSALAGNAAGAEMVLNLLLAGAVGAELQLILLQKNVIRAWCPLCLGIAAVVYLLAAFQIARYLISVKKGFRMNLRSLAKAVLLGVVALAGFNVAVWGIEKPANAQTQLNLYQGKQDSKLEIYLFSDWLCPFCADVEGVIDGVYPTLSQKARFLFVDKIVHPEAANFVPYDLSFATYEKAKYIQLRKALFAVAKKTKNPGDADVKAAIAPLGVTYKQLSFMEVTQQMGVFQKLVEQYKIVSTPTLLIRNARTGKMRTLVGKRDITIERILDTVKELE